ncbi:MAG: GldM family protein [Bacteroidota bacterium]
MFPAKIAKGAKLFITMNRLLIIMTFLLISINLYSQDTEKGTFKVKKPTEEINLIPKIANKTRGAITIEELIGADGITIDELIGVERKNVDDKYKVVAFDMVMNIGSVEIIRGTECNEISSEMKKHIRNAGKGQRIYFKNIKCLCSDGLIRKLPSMTFTIGSMFDE